MIIIGITGTIGAGKGEVVAYLKSNGFTHFSARDFLTEEVVRRGLVINRDTTTNVANDLRTTHSPSYIIEQLYARALAHAEAGQENNVILESIRTPGEVDFLRENSKKVGGARFYLIAIDADPKMRYERISKRKSAMDNVSFEKFIQDEKREMASTNPNEGNIAECVRRADFTIKNEGSVTELYTQIDAFLPTILKK